MMKTTTKTDIENMGALIDEMSLTIRNLSSLATAHGLMDPHVSRVLHDAMDEILITKSVDETIEQLKKVNEGSIPEWSFLSLG